MTAALPPRTLTGVRVIEIAGIGPGPFAAMMLADAGADVVRVDRLGTGADPLALDRFDLLNRGKRSVAIDLKHADGVAVVLELVERADVLIEGFRPGVMERLGLGPVVCLERNPGLVYTRVTGWGQEGPLAPTAGHDIDYIAVAGALHPIGRPGQPPAPPLNLIGDFGGGGLLAAFGAVCALLERGSSGMGQVVDAAMVDGAALLTTMIHGMVAAGTWTGARGQNLLDSGAPFYDVYETSDGEFLAVGAIEPQFYAELLDVLGLADAEMPPQDDRSRWPELRARFAGVIGSRTLAEWIERGADRDACIAPAVPLPDAPRHPHNVSRGVFTEVDGMVQPAPAPRFGRTPSTVAGSVSTPGRDTDDVLRGWGLESRLVAKLRANGAIR